MPLATAAGSFRSGQLEVVQALLAGGLLGLEIRMYSARIQKSLHLCVSCACVDTCAECRQTELLLLNPRRPKRQLVLSFRAGEDVLYVFPTGAGKSLCYQLPALLSKGKSLGFGTKVLSVQHLSHLWYLQQWLQWASKHSNTLKSGYEWQTEARQQELNQSIEKILFLYVSLSLTCLYGALSLCQPQGLLW